MTGNNDKQFDNNEPIKFDIKQEAQQRLVHAMLVSKYQDSPESIAKRVDNVYKQIQRAGGVWHQTWLRVITSMAAGILIIFGLSFLYSNPDNVYADFDDIMKRFSDCDQTYEISIHKIQNINDNDSRSQSKQDLLNMRTVREINGATLYVRGRQYVLERTLRDGTVIFNGFDGYNKWRSDEAEPRKFSKPGSIHRVVPEEVSDLLFVDIGELLNVMCEKYRVTRGRDRVGDMSGLHYLAVKKSRMAGPRLPQKIDLWVDPDTGQIKKLSCYNASFGTKKYHLVIKLKNATPLPLDWFCQRLPEPEEQIEIEDETIDPKPIDSFFEFPKFITQPPFKE